MLFCLQKKGWSEGHVVITPDNQIRPVLGEAAFVSLAHQAVETIEGAVESLIGQDSGKTRYGQAKQQDQNKYRDYEFK